MPKQLHIPWGPIRALLEEEFPMSQKKQIVGAAGLDLIEVARLEQSTPGGSATGKLMTSLDIVYGNMADNEEKERFLTIVVEEMMRRKAELVERLDEYLSRLGWSFVGGHLLPIQLLDPSELHEAPEEAQADLQKAAVRLRNGDLSGAVSAACGAVDSMTEKIYNERNLGDTGDASFQQKVSKCLDAVGALTAIEADLIELGWESGEAEKLKYNLRKSLNQAAYVMQKLRSDMGDVHGTKPTLKPLVFDTLKWAMIIVSLLQD